jgi:hypothetical protein
VVDQTAQVFLDAALAEDGLGAVFKSVMGVKSAKVNAK